MADGNWDLFDLLYDGFAREGNVYVFDFVS